MKAFFACRCNRGALLRHHFSSPRSRSISLRAAQSFKSALPNVGLFTFTQLRTNIQCNFSTLTQQLENLDLSSAQPKIKTKSRSPVPRVGGLYEDYFIERFQSAIRSNKWTSLRELFERSKNEGIPTIEMFETLVMGSMKAKNLQEMMFYWKQMKRLGIVPTQELYHAMIFSSAQFGDLKQAFKFKDDMEINDIPPNINTYAPLLQACATASDFFFVPVIIQELTEKGIPIDDSVVYPFVVRLSQVNTEAEFLEKFNQAMNGSRFMYNVLLGFYCHKARMKEALEILQILRANGHVPDSLTYGLLAIGFCRSRDYSNAMRFYIEGKNEGYFPGIFAFQLLLRQVEDPSCYANARLIWKDRAILNITIDDKTAEMFIGSAIAHQDYSFAQEILKSEVGSLLPPEIKEKYSKELQGKI